MHRLEQEYNRLLYSTSDYIKFEMYISQNFAYFKMVSWVLFFHEDSKSLQYINLYRRLLSKSLGGAKEEIKENILWAAFTIYNDCIRMANICQFHSIMRRFTIPPQKWTVKISYYLSFLWNCSIREHLQRRCTETGQGSVIGLVLEVKLKYSENSLVME